MSMIYLYFSAKKHLVVLVHGVWPNISDVGLRAENVANINYGV